MNGDDAAPVSEVRFRQLLEKLPAGAYTCDAQGLITYYNERAVELWGRAPALHDPVDRFCGSFKLFSPDGAPIPHEECWMALALRYDREYDGCEILIERPDGDRRVALAHANPIHDDDGGLVGAVNVLVDITDRKRAENAVNDANRAKSEFLAAMSHELRTPLNAIAGYVQLLDLEVHGPLSPEQHLALQRVQRSQRHLLSLINDILNFAKLEAGRVEYVTRDVKLVDAVAEVSPMIEPQLAAKRLSYDVRIDPGIVVRADAEKLWQILLNLLSNAVKFTECDGRILVDTGARGDGGGPTGVVFLRVSDTGAGIPSNRLTSIFEPFVQIQRSLTNSSEGTGLGLAISRGLARGMGGDLRVRSVEGSGATFTLMLRSARPNPVRR
ncbi:MAG TPA: ATP-binding protein [Gemmatimonadaceae bacterium]|nr:ATP-binding protein [Gemmatimonadaceae bacterium]